MELAVSTTEKFHLRDVPLGEIPDVLRWYKSLTFAESLSVFFSGDSVSVSFEIRDANEIEAGTTFCRELQRRHTKKVEIKKKKKTKSKFVWIPFKLSQTRTEKSVIDFTSSSESKFEFSCSMNEAINITEWAADNLSLDAIKNLHIIEHHHFSTKEQYFSLSIVLSDKAAATKLRIMEESFSDNEAD